MTPRFQEDTNYDRHLGFARPGFPASYQQRFDQRFPEKNPAPGLRTYGSQERMEFRDRFIAIYETELNAELKKIRKENSGDSVELTDANYEKIFRAIYESDFRALVAPKSNPWALLKQWESKSPRETATEDLDKRLVSWPKYKKDSLWADIFDLTEIDRRIDFNNLLNTLAKSADPEKTFAELKRSTIAHLAEESRQPLKSAEADFAKLIGPKSHVVEETVPVLEAEPVKQTPELLVIDQGRLKLKDPVTGTMKLVSELLRASKPVAVGGISYLVLVNHVGTKKRQVAEGMEGHCAVFAVEVRAMEEYDNQIRYFWDLNEQTSVVAGALSDLEIDKFQLKKSA